MNWLEKDSRMQYRIKCLLAWKEQAEKENNKWASDIATKHILSLQKSMIKQEMTYGIKLH